MENKKIKSEEIETQETIEAQQVEAQKETKQASKDVLIKDALSTGEKLKKQSKKTITVPRSEMNQGDDYVVVAINGYKYKIKRGEEVEVPYSVYKLLKNAKYI